MQIESQSQESVLLITLDSCRYDTFLKTKPPNLQSVGLVWKAMAPSSFSYASHQAIFAGCTPGIAEKKEPFINPKYGEIFGLDGGGFAGKKEGYFKLKGRNIIDGFKRLRYKTIGTAAADWLSKERETGQFLIQDFDVFFHPGNTYSLNKQLKWLAPYLQNNESKFVFLNIGETAIPYYCLGMPWQPKDNPCIPFGVNNRREDCEYRQQVCLRYVDILLAPLLKAFSQSTIVICAAHGDCWGEDGLWEHGFYHPKVLEVPLIVRLAGKDLDEKSLSAKQFSGEKNERSIPDFLIIGVQKGGTTSLFHYLSQHPHTALSSIKEVHYFDNNYDKGMEWYQGHFPLRKERECQIVGEASPYYIFHPLTAQRIKKDLPNAKFIVMLRDPISRAYSHYQMEVRVNNEDALTFEEGYAREAQRLAGEAEKLRAMTNYISHAHQELSYLSRGLYYQQLSKWFTLFRREQFLILKSEDFFSNPLAELKKVYDFLGLDDFVPSDLHPQNVGDYSQLAPETMVYLKDFFREDSENLKDLLGDNFSW